MRHDGRREGPGGVVKVTAGQHALELEDPRDHSRLEEWYNSMHSARFINLTPVSIISSHLSLHMGKSIAYPPLILNAPPRSGMDYEGFDGELSVGGLAGPRGVGRRGEPDRVRKREEPGGRERHRMGEVRVAPLAIGGRLATLDGDEEGEFHRFVKLDRSRAPTERGYSTTPWPMERCFTLGYSTLGMNLSVAAVQG